MCTPHALNIISSTMKINKCFYILQAKWRGSKKFQDNKNEIYLDVFLTNRQSQRRKKNQQPNHIRMPRKKILKEVSKPKVAGKYLWGILWVACWRERTSNICVANAKKGRAKEKTNVWYIFFYHFLMVLCDWKRERQKKQQNKLWHATVSSLTNKCQLLSSLLQYFLFLPPLLLCTTVYTMDLTGPPLPLSLCLPMWKIYIFVDTPTRQMKNEENSGRKTKCKKYDVGRKLYISKSLMTIGSCPKTHKAFAKTTTTIITTTIAVR